MTEFPVINHHPPEPIEPVNPLLLCLPLEKLADVVQKLDDYQKKNHQVRYEKPEYIDNEPVKVYAPMYETDHIEELNKELSQNTDIKERIE